MKNLTFLLFFSLFTFNTSFAQQYGWVPLPWINNTDVIKRIYQTGNEAWLLTNDKLYYSANYPLVQFAEVFTGLTTFSDMTFSNQGVTKYGWIVGYASMGARSLGSSALIWTDMYLSGDLTFSCVSFPTTFVGYGSGTDKRLHRTVNGGVDWFDTGVQLSSGGINSIVFTDTLNGYIGGSAPSFKKTTDGGLNWSSISGYTGTINDIYFHDSSHGWAVGAFDILYYNVSSWIRISNPIGQNLSSVFFVNPTEGWISGNNGVILHSINGGANWTAQSSGTTANLLDVFFTSPTNGYAVGVDGTILHYTLLSGIEEHAFQTGDFELEQNHPNPCIKTTTITWQSAKSSRQTLKVYDVFGNEVAALVDEVRPAGRQSIDFNTEGLPAGVYFYQLRADGLVETKKMIVSK